MWSVYGVDSYQYVTYVGSPDEMSFGGEVLEWLKRTGCKLVVKTALVQIQSSPPTNLR